jgi:hypothetical protein
LSYGPRKELEPRLTLAALNGIYYSIAEDNFRAEANVEAIGI